MTRASQLAEGYEVHLNQMNPNQFSNVDISSWPRSLVEQRQPSAIQVVGSLLPCFSRFNSWNSR